MDNTIYGVDLNGEVTPLMVRDALALCFYDAHCQDSGLGADEKNEGVNREYCKNTVIKAFVDSGGDFEHPAKSSIIAAMQKLMDFSKSFRDPSIIQKHAGEMMQLVEKIES